MPDRSDEFRKLATDCVAIARMTADPGNRAILLTMAQRWFELANGPASNLDGAIRVYNEAQPSDIVKPAMQQQQQIQPKKDE